MPLIPARLQWSDDGALRSLDYGDVYFQKSQPLDESYYVFIEKNNLRARFATCTGDFRIGETGFGTGLNFLQTAKLWHATAPTTARLHYVSFENHPITKGDLARIYSNWEMLSPHTTDLLTQYPEPIAGFHRIHFGNITLTLIYGDITYTAPDLTGMFDAWYLDGFATERNPAMWEAQVLNVIGTHTYAGGTLATYSVARHVLDKLTDAGFTPEKIKGFGVKRKMTAAVKQGGVAKSERLTQHVVIIGAGIAGCAAASALARRGYRVTLLDRNSTVAAETSGNPAAVIYPKMTLDISPLGEYHGHAFSYTRTLLQTMQLPSWQACGVLHLDLTDEDKERSADLLQRKAFPVNILQARETGLFQPAAGFLNPIEFCNALSSHPSISRVFETTIESLAQKDGQWCINNSVTADIVIIAQGHFSKDHDNTAWMPLRPLRGQITYVSGSAESKDLDHVICHEGYITPLVGDLHYIGATFQREEPDDLGVRPADDLENISKLQQYLPYLKLDETHIKGNRHGYRTAPPDKLPMIGRCPDYAKTIADKAPAYINNLYITTGFGAHGMTGAPLAGEMIASLIHGDPLPIAQSLLDYLTPERFILRDIKRGKV